jgi:RNA polymerase sigma factor (sigma-70 family)
MEAISVRSWILRVADGTPGRAIDSTAAFERMYVGAWPRLCRYTWVLVRHHEDAEDVAGETVRRAFGAWQAGRGPAGDPLPWLFLIARRIVIDRNKRRAPRWVSIADGSTARSADALGRVEATDWFDRLRDQLSPRQHEAIVLRYLFDLDDDQIGRIMGLSPAGVRTNVSRGLAGLRRRPEVLDL